VNGAGGVTVASGTFTIGTGANLTAAGGLGVTGGTIAAGSATSTITGSVNYTSPANSTFQGVIAGAGKSVSVGGPGTLTLTAANTYDGPTTISGGVLSVPTMPNGGAASPVGASSSAAATLVVGGGALQYTGPTTTTNRNFTLPAGLVG